MPKEMFYRDPRWPRDIHGPVSIEQLRLLVREGQLRPADQVSLDGQAWLLAAQIEPELFPHADADWSASRPAWKQSLHRAAGTSKEHSKAAWSHLKIVADFYWQERSDLWELLKEYISFLKEPGTRREIRVAADDHNEAVSFDGDQWSANLPDCCVVCGEAADCDWNSEQRSVPNLNRALLCPFLGLLFGVVAWMFLWKDWGKWMIPLGILAGFLVGYRQRGDTIVRIRFRRCRLHLARTRLPRLRIFRRTLIIGVGDRKVWRRFYYGDHDIETPMSVPPEFSKGIERTRALPEENDGRPSYPTLPLAGDDPNEGPRGMA
jgi:hypothetical protein